MKKKRLTLALILFALFVISSFAFIGCTNVSVSSLALDTTFVNKEFFRDDEFTYDGLKVFVIMNNGSVSELEKDEYTVIAPSMTTAGTKNVQVNYENFSAFYPITVKTVEVSDLEINIMSVKKTFNVGEEFNFIGLKVSLIYNNGENKEISSGFEVKASGVADGLFISDGMHTVTVKYLNFVKTYEVRVERQKESGVTDLILDASEVKKIYFIGEAFSADKLKVTAVYDDGSTGETNDYKIFVEGGESNLFAEIGNRTVTVSFAGLQKTFTVFVLPSVVDASADILKFSTVENNANLTLYISNRTVTENKNVTAEGLYLFENGEEIFTFDFGYEYDSLSAVHKFKENDGVTQYIIKDTEENLNAGDLAVSVNGVDFYAAGDEWNYKIAAMDFVKHIKFSNLQIKTEYYTGEQFLAPAVLAVYYGGTEEIVSENELKISGYDLNVAGTQTVSIFYGNLEPITYEITVIEREIVDIKIVDATVKYSVGDRFSADQLKVYPRYRGENEFSTDELDSRLYSCEPDPLAIVDGKLVKGTFTVAVVYTKSNGEEIRRTFEIVVDEPPLNSITLNLDGFKTVYNQGETLDFSAIVVIGEYGNGTTLTINIEDCNITGDYTAGRNVITVSYGDAKAEFEIMVIPNVDRACDYLKFDSLSDDLTLELFVTSRDVYVSGWFLYKNNDDIFMLSYSYNCDGDEHTIEDFDGASAISILSDGTLEITVLNDVFSAEYEAWQFIILSLNRAVAIEAVNPIKNYFVGDEFVKPSIRIKKYDETEEILEGENALIEFYGYDSTQIGTQIITVVYNETEKRTLTAKYEISVTEAEINKNDSLLIETDGVKRIYCKGESLSLDNLSIFKVSGEGVKSEISLADCTVESADTSSVGVKTVTISYGESSGKILTATFEICVIPIVLDTLGVLTFENLGAGGQKLQLYITSLYGGGNSKRETTTDGWYVLQRADDSFEMFEFHYEYKPDGQHSFSSSGVEEDISSECLMVTVDGLRFSVHENIWHIYIAGWRVDFLRFNKISGDATLNLIVTTRTCGPGLEGETKGFYQLIDSEGNTKFIAFDFYADSYWGTEFLSEGVQEDSSGGDLIVTVEGCVFSASEILWHQKIANWDN